MFKAFKLKAITHFQEIKEKKKRKWTAIPLS